MGDILPSEETGQRGQHPRMLPPLRPTRRATLDPGTSTNRSALREAGAFGKMHDRVSEVCGRRDTTDLVLLNSEEAASPRRPASRHRREYARSMACPRVACMPG